MSEIICNYCVRSIALHFHVQCAECENFYLCQDCFASGVNLYPHENNHKYKISNCLEVPVFQKEWTALEELQLLRGVEKYGMGNWKTIADYLGNKSTKQVEEHYFEHYMGIHGYCLPVNTIGNEGVVKTESFSVMESEKLVDFDDALYETIGKSIVPNIEAMDSYAPHNVDIFHTIANKGYSSGNPVERDVGKETGPKAKEKAEIRDRLALLPGSDLPGFIPLREDFDIEFENDAEEMLADMEFSPDDHQSERELKLQVIKIYNNKLDERNRRKRFVIDRGLIDFKQQQHLERRRTKEERELVGKLRIFARFHSQAEHEVLIDCVLKAKRLRQHIELYKHYRQIGVKTLDEAKKYEMDKRDREKSVKAKRHRESASYLFETGRQSSSQEVLVEEAPYVSQTSSAGDKPVTGRRRGRASGIEGDGEESNSPRGRNGKDRGDAPASPKRRGGPGRGRDKNNGEGSESPAVEKDTDQERNEYIAIIKQAPGADLLSPMETALCSRIPMLPLHFLAAKDAIVREAFRNGSLTEEGVTRVLKVDNNKAAVIFDFFVKDLQINSFNFGKH